MNDTPFFTPFPNDTHREAAAYLRALSTGEVEVDEDEVVGLCWLLAHSVPWGVAGNGSYGGYDYARMVFRDLGYDPDDPLAAEGFSYTHEPIWRGEAGAARRRLAGEMADYIEAHYVKVPA